MNGNGDKKYGILNFLFKLNLITIEKKSHSKKHMPQEENQDLDYYFHSQSNKKVLNF